MNPEEPQTAWRPSTGQVVVHRNERSTWRLGEQIHDNLGGRFKAKVLPLRTNGRGSVLTIPVAWLYEDYRPGYDEWATIPTDRIYTRNNKYQYGSEPLDAR